MTTTETDPWLAEVEEPERHPSVLAANERFARYQRQRNGGHLTPRQIRRLVKKGGTCGSPADDGTTCFLPLDHKRDFCESSTGPWFPWLSDPWEGEHSPADEYLLLEARACTGYPEEY